MALLALALVGGALVVADTPAAQRLSVEVETDVATAYLNNSGGEGNVSVQPTSSNASDANGSTRANASSGGSSAEVRTDPSDGEGEVNVSLEATELKVQAGDGRLVNLSYTPPGAEDPVETVRTELEEPTDEPEAEPAGTQTTNSDGEDDASVAWTVAPLAGVAAAAAAGAVAPTPWLRRLWPGTTVAPMYSRISREDVLDHDTREAIYEALTDQPGLSLGELCDRLDLARSTARHHVRKLEAVGMIEHAKLGRSRVHYPVGFERKARRRHLLDNDTRRAVYAALEAQPRNLSEVADAIGANPGSVHFHVQKLVDAGLVAQADGKRYRTVDLEVDARVDPATP